MKQVYNANPLFRDDMKVAFDSACDGKYVSLTTYSRKRGYQGRFLIDRDKLQNWYLGGCETEIMDRDIGSFLYGYEQSDGKIRLEIRWLSLDDVGGDITGNYQAFDMTKDEFVKVVFRSEPLTKLCWDKREPCHVDASGAEGVLKEIQRDKRMKRAFSKAMREFQWRGGQTIYLGPDFPRRAGHDFFFRTSSGTVGGLILSEYDGHMKYNVHT